MGMACREGEGEEGERGERGGSPKEGGSVTEKIQKAGTHVHAYRVAGNFGEH